MKWSVFLLCSALILVAGARILPDDLPKFCSRSVPNYSECTAQTLRKLGPRLVKGVREINFPKLNPLRISLLKVNRTLNDFVSIDSSLTNAELWGLNTTHLRYFKFDLESKHGEIHLHMPLLSWRVESDVSGNLFSLDIQHVGVFTGNATDVEDFFKFSLKPVERLGVRYYTLDDFVARSTIGNAYIKIASKNPNLQYAVDLIQNFVNEDPRRAIDAVRPIYEEVVTAFYRKLAEDVLYAIPADELIPN